MIFRYQRSASLCPATFHHSRKTYRSSYLCSAADFNSFLPNHLVLFPESQISVNEAS